MSNADCFSYKFGIEEEYFLSSAVSGALAVGVARDVIESAESELRQFLASEMLQSQIEIASPVFDSYGAALSTMTELRGALARVARSLNYP